MVDSDFIYSSETPLPKRRSPVDLASLLNLSNRNRYQDVGLFDRGGLTSDWTGVNDYGYSKFDTLANYGTNAFNIGKTIFDIWGGKRALENQDRQLDLLEQKNKLEVAGGKLALGRQKARDFANMGMYGTQALEEGDKYASDYFKKNKLNIG